MKKASQFLSVAFLLSSVAAFQPSQALNKDQLQGQWREFKGNVQDKWGKLTDNDMDKIKGNYNELVGVVQQKYRLTKEKASEQVDAFLDSLEAKKSDASQSADDFKENAQEVGTQMKKDGKGAWQDVKSGTKKARKKTKNVAHKVADKVKS